MPVPAPLGRGEQRRSRGGAVSITTRLDGEHALVEVADTGKGIPRTEQVRIFEEYYQLDNPGRDRRKGVGLGLAIVQRLCERIGAEIAVKSEPGLGSRFTLRIPDARSAVAEIAPSRLRQASVPLPASFAGLRVYLVDDECDILTGMRWLLGAWDTRVYLAGSIPGAAKTGCIGCPL